jgi:hypothetical protein
VKRKVIKLPKRRATKPATGKRTAAKQGAKSKMPKAPESEPVITFHHGGKPPRRKRRPVDPKDRDDIFMRMVEQESLLRCFEIMFLKACGWKPADVLSEIDGSVLQRGQERLELGNDPVKWTRGVVSEEPLDEFEALALAREWFVAERNEAGWR